MSFLPLLQTPFAQDNLRFFFDDAPRFRKPAARDNVCFFFALLRLSRRPHDIKFLFCFFCTHCSTDWMTIRQRQSRTTAIVFSFAFVGVVQPTGLQGTTYTTKERKENDQAVT
jgi:hypothetical protein